MAEEEIMAAAAFLDSSILERRKICRQDLVRKKEGREESLLRRTLLKAANEHMIKSQELPDAIPAISVSIGEEYSCFTGEDVTVTVFFIYNTQRLQWEIIEGPLRCKLEFRWHDIAGLELKLNECGLACLTIEVNHPPACLMYDPESKIWSYIGDYTDDDDEIKHNLLPHYAVFKPGIVDESYEALLNYRKEEAVLNEKHFQLCQKKRLRRQKKQAKLSEKNHHFLESKPHQQLEKEENK